MNLKEYFEMGRKQELEYERKQKTRTIARTNKKPSPYSFAGLLIGAGVFYQIISPTVNRMLTIVSAVWVRTLKPTFDVIRTDLKMLVMKIRGVNPEWEQYKQFCEYAKGGQQK